MFFYRFICSSSLVTNVTKKSSKSFQDRELHANSLHRWSRARGVLGPFFLATAGILVARGFMAAQAFTAAQDSSAFALSPDFGNRADSGNSFGNSFGNKFFLEPLCFSIDSSVLALLLPMLPKNPQKVSRIGNSMQTVCIGGLGLEGF